MKRYVLYPLRMPKLPTTDRDAVRFGAILKRLRLSRGWTIIRHGIMFCRADS